MKKMKSIDNTDKRDKIAQALNKNLSISVEEELPIVSISHVNDDYEASRKTYKELIVKGSEAIDLMMDLAKDSQHPRAFEVLATLLKTQADNNDKLLDLQKRLKQIKEPSKDSSKNPSHVINNTSIFYGSTTDLQKFLRDNNKTTIDVTPE